MASLKTMFCAGVLIIIAILSRVDCQICNSTMHLTRWTRETYSQTYRESYYGNCYYRCIRYRIRTFTAVRSVPKNVVEYKKECCDGFTEVASVYDEFKCEPICFPSCRNGFCKSPGQCACHDGYQLKNYVCTPICNTSCGHGDCIEPNKCRCHYGYEFQNGTCAPLCSEPCINGTCVAPDTCDCLVGYRKSENNLCAPYCSIGCLHGTCVSPENCRCDNGWYNNNDNICTPNCSIDCGGGKCVLPEICECFENYEKSANGTCLPVCPNGCSHGTCVSPGNCTCDDGWSKNEEKDLCEPVCDFDCGEGGACFAPNVCECKSNYGKTANGTCVPSCSKGCPNGECVRPEVCECQFGYIFNKYNECVPHCEKPCGNGTCEAPQVCKCFKGFKLDEENVADFFDEPLCVPSCKSCNGTCVAPDLCNCEYPYVSKYVSVSNEDCDCHTNCSVNSTTCDHVVCILKNNYIDMSTDVTDSLVTETYIYSVKYGEDDAITDIPTEEDNIMKEVRNNFSDSSSLKNTSNLFWSQYWIYVVSLALALVTILAVILFVKRRTLADLCDRGAYPLEDEKELDISTSA